MTSKNNASKNDKLSNIKEKQSKWMQQRADSLKHDSLRTKSQSLDSLNSKKTPSASKQSTMNQKSSNKRSDIIMWTAKTPGSDTFVVRKQPSVTSKKTGTASKPLSSRSSVSRPSSARSDNFENSLSKRNTSTKNMTQIDSVSKDDLIKNLNLEDSQDFSTSDIYNPRTYQGDSMFDSHFSSSENQKQTGKFPKHQHELPNIFNSQKDPLDTYSSLQRNFSGHNDSQKYFTSHKDPSEDFMPTHICPMCKKNMLSENHAPFLVFPCAHTFCHSCIKGETSCPSCRCKIACTQKNDSLHSVIQQYKVEQDKIAMRKKEEEVRRYVEEYQSLNSRADVLKSEAESIITNMEEITEKLVTHKQSIANSAESSVNIKQQIIELEATLKKLEERQLSETEACEELEEDYESEKSKLGMIEKTLTTIDHSCDRIRLMVENISPEFNIDQFI